MKTQNRFFMVVMFIAMVSLAGLWSCSDMSSNPPDVEKPELTIENFVNPFEIIGEIHNEGLDEINSNVIKDIKNKDNINPRNIKEIVKISVKDLFMRRDIDFSEQIFEEEVKNADILLKQLNRARLAKTAVSTSYTMAYKRNDDILNDVQKEFMAKALDSIRRMTDIESLNNELRDNEFEAYKELGFQKAAPILLISAVGKHSAAYWKENYLKSSILLAFNYSKNKEEFVKNLGKQFGVEDITSKELLNKTSGKYPWQVVGDLFSSWYDAIAEDPNEFMEFLGSIADDIARDAEQFFNDNNHIIDTVLSDIPLISNINSIADLFLEDLDLSTEGILANGVWDLAGKVNGKIIEVAGGSTLIGALACSAFAGGGELIESQRNR